MADADPTRQQSSLADPFDDEDDVSTDPWESLSPCEDDLGYEPDLTLADPDEPITPDESYAAEANALAVEAAAALRLDEPENSADEEFAPEPPRRRGGGALTIPMLCAGIAIIAACLLIPQADANRRLVYERARLQADLQAVEEQVKTNDEFLQKVGEDPNLAERLAQRQMKIIRKGNEVLTLKHGGDEAEMSPFQLTAIPAPRALPPYQPRGGMLAELCYNPKSRLYLLGIGLFAVAGGLVLGFGGKEQAA